jgi:amino acid transporter
MKKTLGLLGVTMNAMALIAPGAFLWITYQEQAAQTDPTGALTASDMWFGLLVALAIAFLTAISYSLLAERYPEARSGSSYTFAVKAFLDRGTSTRTARIAKFIVGWLSHLYYWVYPGVMVAFMAIFISFIFQTFGLTLSPIMQIGIAALFAILTGFIAYRGITTSTVINITLNIVQWVMLVGITVMALTYRFLNPQHVTFVLPSVVSIALPHNASHVLFQATIAILLLVGFESATALMAEAKKASDVARGVLIALVVQGLFCYLFEYFGAQAWINNSYKVVVNGKTFTGFAAAAQSSAPIGDMVRNLGNVFLAGNGLELMLVVAVAVAAAVVGTTLACVNTGVRISYAMGRDGELPLAFGKLHSRLRSPYVAILVLTVVSAVIGAFGVLSIGNLTAITLLSNIGTFLLYGLTNVVAFLAFAKERGSVFIRRVVPNLGAAANIGMLFAIVWLAILGGGMTKYAAVFAIAGTGVWAVIGVAYFVANSRTAPSALLPYRGKEPGADKMFPREIRRNLRYESGSEEPRYYLEVDLNEVVPNRSARLPVYWRSNITDPVLKEVYFTEVGGVRIEKGNLTTLVDAVPEAIRTLVTYNTLPYYLITLPNGVTIPFYLVNGRLQTTIGTIGVGGGDIEKLTGCDIGELYHKLSEYLISNEIIKSGSDLTVSIFLWRDLKQYPPAFVFRDDNDRVWIPIFSHGKGELNYDIINQPSRILRVEGLLSLRREVIASLISAKAISSPYSMYMDQVTDELWSEMKKMLRPLDQYFVCETEAGQKLEISTYALANELIAASRPRIFFGQDLEQLRSEVTEDLKKEGLIRSSTYLRIEKRRR